MATATQSTITQAKAADLWSVLSARAGRRPGRLYKSGDAAFVDGVAVDPVVDLANMSATFCISKPIEDRSADIVNPEGFILENYRLNPVIFYDHGFGSITMPIGRSEDDGGSLTIAMSPEETLGTCYFSKKTPEGYQTFALVDEKILRAASVNILPIDADVREPEGPNGRPGLLIKSCELIEWSVVGIPDNPEAVRKLLDRGKLGGETICEPLLKSLRSHAAPIPHTGRGWTPPGITKTNPITQAGGSAVTDEEKAAEEKANRRKAAEEAEQEVKKAQAKAAQLRKDAGMDDKPPEEPGQTPKGDEEPDGDDGASPMGAQVLKATHDSLSEIADHLDETAKVLEPDSAVKGFVESLSDEMKGHMARVAELHKERYPDEPDLTKEMDSSDPNGVNNSPPEASGAVKMASFLARSKSNRLSLKGVAFDLGRLAACKNLTQLQRDTVNRLAKSLSRINKAADAGAAEAPTSDALKRLEGLEKAIDGIADAVQKAIPHRRS